MSKDPIVDPPRMSDEGSDAPEFLRDLLNTAHGDGASREELRDVASALGPILGSTAGGAAGGAAGGVATGAAGTSAGTAAGVGGAALTGSVGGAVKLTLAAGAVIAIGVVAVTFVLPEEEAESPEVIPSRVASPEAALEEVPPALEPSATGVSEALQAQSLRDEDAPRRRRRARSRVIASETAAELARPAAEPAAEPEPSELELLEAARTQKRRNAAAALAVLREHESRYPRGALTQERMVLIVDVLLRMGRRQQARASAEAFFRRFPTSVHRRRVEALLSGQAPD